jgi:hypothetical protein
MIRRIPLLLLLAWGGAALERAAAQNPAVDQVTAQLFEQYVARQAKIDSESVMAATHLVAARGRETGFWKVVLAELQQDNPGSEIGCLRVLGKMLATDAAARDAIQRREETGEISAWIPTVCLGPEVVAELLQRGRKADRFRIDHYVIALARARTPAAKDFFLAVLRTPAEPGDPYATTPHSVRHLDSTCFHAAVGLAQLGAAEGFDWLIAHCEFRQGSVTNAWPGVSRGGNLSDCCQEALRQLSDQRQSSSAAEWAAWRQSVDWQRLPRRAVVFRDS